MKKGSSTLEELCCHLGGWQSLAAVCACVGICVRVWCVASLCGGWKEKPGAVHFVQTGVLAIASTSHPGATTVGHGDVEGLVLLGLCV